VISATDQRVAASEIAGPSDSVNEKVHRYK
jgi:hypothetical protein